MPGDVKDFWAYMSQRYRTKVIQKSDAFEMKLVGQFLDRIGIVDNDAFMRNYTTTVGTTIYTPFIPGFTAPDWDLFSQIRVCAHEHQHVVQYKTAGALVFTWDYVTSTARRTLYEIEAYRTGMELTWRYLKQVQNVRAIAAGLKNYGCTADDVKVAEKALLLAIPTIKAGGLTTEVGRVAAEWLDRRFVAAA
jgi:hypothetical protein